MNDEVRFEPGSRFRIAIQRFGRPAFRIVRNALAIFGLGVILFHTSFILGRVRTSSMAPALVGDEWARGDLLLSESWTYRFRRPRRWEVVTFKRNDGDYVCKRVVGLPGETVLLRRNGDLEINGTVVARPTFLKDHKYLAAGNMADGKPFECERGYYVLGDDSRDSDDSRFNGSVRPDTIEARALLILSPCARFGWVN